MKLRRIKAGKTDIDILIRPDTKDEFVVREIFQQHCYRLVKLGFDVEEGEKWLDLGAHIGVFAYYAVFDRLAAEVHCYEPEPLNYRVLIENCSAFTPFKLHRSLVSASKSEKLELFGDAERNNTRFSVFSSPRYNEGRLFDNTYIGGLTGFNGIKMDIEGAELEMMDLELIPKCDKLVMEYHCTKDRDMVAFQRRMKYLRSKFKIVHYSPGLDRWHLEGDRTFPGRFDQFVFCKDWIG